MRLSHRWGVVLSAVVIAALPVPAAAQRTFRFVTLAPEGSIHAKLFHEWNRAVRERTKGRVRLKFQMNAFSEDERTMVRALSLGRVQGAALTGVGIGLLQPEFRIMELPFLIRTDGELDYVRRRLEGFFRRKLEERGYVLLAWADSGWVYPFSKQPIQTLAAFKRAKMWVWADDPMARAFLEEAGCTVVPLGVPDVLSGLATGQIDWIYGPPLGLLITNWYTKVKYVVEYPFCVSTGAVIVSKKDFDQLAPEDQKALLETAKALERKIQTTLRRQNVQAMAQLRKAGIRVVRPEASGMNELRRAGHAVWKQLGGKLFSVEGLEQVQQALADYRRGKR